MTVVGLHPEELFDKLLDGDITSIERERLRSHLDACEVCRFEYAARLDFQEEALSLSALGAPPALPLLPLRTPIPVAEEPVRVPVRRRRSRLLVWGLAAAALITASGALASALTGRAPWRAMNVMLWTEQPTAPSVVAATTKPKARASLCVGADCAAPVAVAVQAPLEQPVSAPASEPVVEVAPAPRHHAASAARPRAEVVAAKVATSRAEVAEAPVAKEPAKEISPAAKLFGEANQARRSGDIGRASGLYHLLQDQYPGSGEAELSRVTLALLLLDSGDAQGALKGFERYLAGGSRGLEAEALVGRARALGRLGRRDLETSAWREVQRKFPRSIYGRQATERLAALGQP